MTKLNPTGSALVYSTYLGGSGGDSGRSIVVDAVGNAYVMGETNSSNFPTTPGAFQPTLGGSFDTFVTKLNLTGSALVYSTYLGGSGFDQGRDVALDALPNPNAYVTGLTQSLDFPTTAEAFQTTFGGVRDGFVAKIMLTSEAGTADLSVTKTDAPDPVLVGDHLTYTLTVTNHGPADATDVTLTDMLPRRVVFVSSSPGAPTCNASAGTVTCDLGTLTDGDSTTVTITVRPTATGTLSNTAEVAGNETDPDAANNTDTETTTVNPVTCGGLPATIVGTPGNDVLNGTNGRDVIHGLSGDDTIHGRGDDDIICGGNGNDTITGGPGRDRLLGEDGHDTLHGNNGDDALHGGAGTDTCNGGNGADTAANCARVTSVP